MTWRSTRSLFVLSALLVLIVCCREKRKAAYSYKYPGYYYRLLSFNADTSVYRPGQIAWVTVTFGTQSDSVFWDSHNNGKDRLFFKIDSSAPTHFIAHFVSTLAAGDSACLLIRPSDFFSQQFGSDSVPFFSKQDTVVTIHLKLNQILSPEAFEKREVNLQAEEFDQIEEFFGSAQQMEMALDALGFYWIQRPVPNNAASIGEGDLITLSYQGYFLNGRPLERSRSNFEYVYGTPDQLLKGLNYVSGKLKLGQNAKILLPSRLAFGENGNSNGTVPLFTPLIYELKIIDVKKTK